MRFIVIVTIAALWLASAALAINIGGTSNEACAPSPSSVERLFSPTLTAECRYAANISNVAPKF